MAKKIKVCVDLDRSFDNSLFGLYNAHKERPQNVLNENSRRILNGDTLPEQALIDSKQRKDFNTLLSASQPVKNKLNELAVVRGKLWDNGRTLKVKFLGGSPFLHKAVEQYAKEWEHFANIRFEFITSGDAELRVAFIDGRGSWSCVGTDALNITDQNEPTINFGWFDDSTDPMELCRTTVHEFGHALGCIHEHQSPAAGINWNRPNVYDYYAKTQVPPWTPAQVDHNIFRKYTTGEVTNSTFDPRSIMLYPIPADHTIDGFTVGMNNMISRQDADFISRCYPRTP